MAGLHPEQQYSPFKTSFRSLIAPVTVRVFFRRLIVPSPLKAMQDQFYGKVFLLESWSPPLQKDVASPMVTDV